jgi:adenosylhomocysteine nucleosidase
LKVLVTFALDNEFAPWRKVRGFQPAGLGSHPSFEAHVGVADVRVLLTGVRCRMADRAIRACFEWSPEVVISSGFAGGLRAVYRHGTILAARRVFDDRFDARFARESDTALFDCASRQGAVPALALYTSETMCLTAEDKRRASGRADAVDMESYIIMGYAATAMIPAIALRAVSDTAADDLPFDMNRVLTDIGQVSVSRILAQVALRPQSVPSLVRLGQQSRRAADSLGRFLDIYVATLARQRKQREGRVSAAGRARQAV